MDNCGAPNRANTHYGVLIGRNVDGGTETDWVDVYLCSKHDSGLIEDALTFDGAENWEILGLTRTELR